MSSDCCICQIQQRVLYYEMFGGWKNDGDDEDIMKQHIYVWEIVATVTRIFTLLSISSFFKTYSYSPSHIRYMQYFNETLFAYSLADALALPGLLPST